MRLLFITGLPVLSWGCFVTLAPCGGSNAAWDFEGNNLGVQCGDGRACVGSSEGMYDAELDYRFCSEGHWAMTFVDGSKTIVQYKSLNDKSACLAGTAITVAGGSLSQSPCNDEGNHTHWDSAKQNGWHPGMNPYIGKAGTELCLKMLPSRAEIAATEISQLWHPYFLMYSVQVVGHLIATFLSIKYPKALMVLIFATGFVYPISYFGNINTWTFEPGDFMWISLFAKWIIVDLLATLPVLYIKSFDVTERQIHIVSLFVYGILGTNVITTLLLSKPYIVMNVNNGTAVTLSISLILRCIAVARHPKMELFTKSSNGLIFGFGTPFCWLVCYSVWNGLFIASFTAGGSLQVILFWLMMFYYWCQDAPRRPIEFYFAYARPVELGTFIGISELCGTLVPYFKNAIALDKHSPIVINSHAYFFFITVMNFIFSLIVLWWSVQEFRTGIQEYPAQRTFDEDKDSPASVEMMAAESQS